ncbi:MAG: CotH kinase family protein [Crocinitomicaceae bacterium]|nr:CotH kinase family protein [Crocinitomicaceae bacterium]
MSNHIDLNNMCIIRIVLFLLIIPATALSQALYDPLSVTAIDITFSQSNWDELLDQYYAAGDEQRLSATVVINGQTFVGSGVKYKGNSTYNPNNSKNPLNIKLDYTIDQDYEGFNTLKLANGRKDPSWVREVLSYEILRNYMDAPRSNYAWVTINGADYGLMVSTESVNSEFIDSHFYGDNDNTLVKCNPAGLNGGGGGAPGCIPSNNCSLQYLGTDSACYYNYYEMQSDYGWGELRDLTYNVINNFLNIDDFLDRDRFIWMLAFNNVLVNLDSYTGPFVQNYYVYRDDFGVWNPVVWDLNESLGAFRKLSNGGGGTTTDTQLQQMDPFLRSNAATWPMLNKVLPNPMLRRMYVAHCRTMLEENFLNNRYSQRALELQEVVDDLVEEDPNDFYSYSDFITNINGTVNTGGGAMSSVIGITSLMESRKIFMMSNSEFTASPPVIHSIEAPQSGVPDQTINITVNLSDATYAMIGWRKNQREHFTHTEMLDDGMHNDGAANDGLYSISLLLPMGGLQYFIYAENGEAGIFSPPRAEHEFYRIGSTGELVINEVQGRNNSTSTDQAGDYSDWIELYNASGFTIDLSGYYLSDEDDNPAKWQLPAVTLSPDEYFIIWCDGEQNEGMDHCNFKLPSEGGETVTLSNSLLEAVDLIFVPALEADNSYARYPNGDGAFKIMLPTFNANNSESAGIGKEEQKTFSIYPNPVPERFYIIHSSDWNGSIKIYDVIGKVILQLPYLHHSAGTTETVLTEGLAQGTYIVNCGGVSKMIVKN